jgi:hypothetical protein
VHVYLGRQPLEEGGQVVDQSSTISFIPGSDRLTRDTRPPCVDVPGQQSRIAGEQYCPRFAVVLVARLERITDSRPRPPPTAIARRLIACLRSVSQGEQDAARGKDLMQGMRWVHTDDVSHVLRISPLCNGSHGWRHHDLGGDLDPRPIASPD